ncbi:flagellar type III secretion system pore protein FliP [Acidisoma sp. 7E03]
MSRLGCLAKLGRIICVGLTALLLLLPLIPAQAQALSQTTEQSQAAQTPAAEPAPSFPTVDGIPLLTATPNGKGDTYSLNVQTLLIITGLAFLPGILLLMTAFTRIIIVLSIFRQALGLQSTPPNMVLAALALALTVFVMRGVIAEEQREVIQPYLAGEMNFQSAVQAAVPPIQKFMLDQTRKQPLHLFVDLSGRRFASPQDVPLTILVPAFATSELETAFQIGFLIYVPFVLVDLAVASILMSLGMIMVSPTLISLPLKLLMFVSIHGWTLLLGSVAHSFLGVGG